MALIRSSAVTAAAAVLLLVFALLPAAAVTVRIADFAAAPRPECVGQCTQQCPCATLQAALNAATEGDTVWLVPPADGSAIPCEGATTDKSVVVAAAPSRTVVLACAEGQRALWLDGRGRAELGRAVVANVTIRGGAGHASHGGCLRSDDMSLEVAGCRLEHCISSAVSGGGGGVAVLFHRAADGARVAVRDSAFEGCSATAMGGGLLVLFLGTASDAVVNLADTTFASTQALWGGGVLVWLLQRAPRSVLALSGLRFLRTSAILSGGAVYVQCNGDAAHALVSLADSTFVHTRAGYRGGAVAVAFVSNASHASVPVTRCRFERATCGSVGGALFVTFDATTQRPAVSVAHSAFLHTYAQEFGGALGVIFLTDTHSAALAVTHCSFFNSSTVGVGGAVYLQPGGVAEDMAMVVDRCAFDGVHASSGGGVAVMGRVAPGVAVSLSNSLFAHSHATIDGGAAYVMFGDCTPNATATVASCSFADSSAGQFGGAVALLFFCGPDAHVAVSRNTFARTSSGNGGGAVYLQFVEDAPRAFAAVTQSEFADTRARQFGGAVTMVLVGNARAAALVVADCTFANTSAGTFGGAVHWLSMQDSAAASLSVTNSSFQGTHAGVEGGAIHLTAARAEEAEFAADIARCTFADCTAAERAGAVFAALTRHQSPRRPMFCMSNTVWQRREWQHSSTLTVRDCSFRRVACTAPTSQGGVVSLAGGLLHFSRSNVTHTAARAAGGFLHTSGSAGVRVTDVRVEQAYARASAFIRHEGAGELLLSRTSLLGGAGDPTGVASESEVTATSAAAPPRFDSGSVLLCNVGETFANASLGAAPATELWAQKMGDCAVPVPSVGMVTVEAVDVRWQCVPCAPGTYFLGAGRMYDAAATTGKCAQCPFGADCRGGADVRADPGMWGSAVASSEGGEDDRWPALPRSLVRCAEGYCCRDAATCSRFDSCAPTRTGVLCGDCEAGSVGVLGSSACRPLAQCGRAVQDVLFWPGSLVLVLALVAWQVRSASVHWDGKFGGRRHGTMTAGMTKASFAFFQSFPLLLLGDSTTSSAGSALYSAVTQLFSFQLQASGSGGSGVCILGGVTPLGAEAVRVGMVLLVLACGLPAVWAAHWALGWFGPGWLPLRLQPPRLHVYGGALTALVMLTYSVVTGAVVKLVKCAAVEGLGQRLLIQGSVVCWTREVWWQWAAAAWGVGNSLFTPVSVAVGGWLLRKHAIGAGWFWVSLVLPLPCVVAWWASGRVAVACHGDLWRSISAKTLTPAASAEPPQGPRRLRAAALMALGAGYRDELWWWDAVLLLRRLVLTLLPLALRASPVLHAVAAQLLLVMLLLAHVKLQPMSSPAAGAVETLYLLSLLVLSALSIPSGTLLAISAQDPQHGRFLAGAVTALLLVPCVATAACFAWSNGLLRQLCRRGRAAAPVSPRATTGNADTSERSVELHERDRDSLRANLLGDAWPRTAA